MTNDQFKTFVRRLNARGLEDAYLCDVITARDVRPFDSKLADLIETLAESKLAVGQYLKARFEP